MYRIHKIDNKDNNRNNHIDNIYYYSQ